MKPSYALTRHLIRSIINPIAHAPVQSLKQLSWEPRSLLCLANSRNIQKATDGVLSIQRKYPSLQIILGCVDSVHQDMISEVWFDKEMKILSGEVLEIEGRRNTEIETDLSLHFENLRVKLGLLESFGFNDYSYTLFYKPLGQNFAPPLAKLDVQLPIIPSSTTTFTSLVPISDWLGIDEHLDNVIKKISKKPASSMLIDSLKSSSLISDKETTRIFAEVRGPEHSSNIYEIIAGGGEYGSKSEMLVFEDFKAQGNSLECRFLVSDTRKSAAVEGMKGLVVEQIHDENRVVDKEEDLIVDGAVRIGSTKGFELDGVNFKAVNDLVNVKF